MIIPVNDLGGLDPAEAVSIKEWFDVIVELPEEYHGLFPPRFGLGQPE